METRVIVREKDGLVEFKSPCGEIGYGNPNVAKIAQRAKNVQVRFKPLLVMLLG